MKRCPDCGTPVDNREAYCTNCGTSLRTASPADMAEDECWNCGQPLVEDANFCECCGSDQTPSDEGDTRRCWRCGELLVVQADRCHACDEPQPPHDRSRDPEFGELFCFICGAVVHEDDNFCTLCGTALGG